jgi:ABC-type Mn2+/Zn2+ transport system permease subunit
MYLLVSSICGAIGLYIVYANKLWREITIFDIVLAVIAGGFLLGFVAPSGPCKLLDKPIIKIKKD